MGSNFLLLAFVSNRGHQYCKMIDRSVSQLSLFTFGLAVFIAGVFTLSICAQQETSPTVVRPGAPGQPTKILPVTTRATLPPRSLKDVEFMQGMIMHHAQAVEMTDMIGERTQNENVRSLGSRISHSQIEEMKFMRRWLEARGEPVEMKMAAKPGSSSHDHSSGGHSSANKESEMLMPGMLSKLQLSELKKARGAEFDKLFLAGMIQHHDGALIMVKDLFDTSGAGQDAELFNFATDVDTGQRAEIRLMRNMLVKMNVKEKL